MIMWATLESIVLAGIMKELGGDAKKTVEETAKTTFAPRVRKLVSLLKRHGNAHKDAIDLLNGLISFSQRNNIVHGMVIVGVPDQLTFVNHVGSHSVRVSFTSAELESHLLAVNAKTDELKGLLGLTDEDAQKVCDAMLAAAAPAAPTAPTAPTAPAAAN